jgi:hypothetical protein
VPRAADLSFSAQVARRFPLSSETFAPMSAVSFGYEEAAKGDRLQVSVDREGDRD